MELFTTFHNHMCSKRVNSVQREWPIDIFIGFKEGRWVVYDPGVSEYRCIFAPAQEIHTRTHEELVG